MVPIEQEAGWALELVWMLWSTEKSLASARDWTQTSQPVTLHYTD